MIKVMLLAAGCGKRLRPLTETLPKALIPLNEKPIIAYLIERLAAQNLREIVVNVAHFSENIVEFLKEGEEFGVNIQYSYEPIGGYETGGGVKYALPLLGADPVIVINTDIYTDYPFARLPKFIESSSALRAHLVLVPNPADQGGDLALDKDRISKTASLPHYTFSGIGIYRPELFSLERRTFFRIPEVLETPINKREISGEVYHGKWFDINSLERLEILRTHLA